MNQWTCQDCGARVHGNDVRFVADDPHLTGLYAPLCPRCHDDRMATGVFTT